MGFTKKELFDNAEHEEQKVEAMAMIDRFFNGDSVRVDLWMRTGNVLLAGHSPLQMISEGRGNKLLRWMRSALAENEQ